jgi:hypothetical protein
MLRSAQGSGHLRTAAKPRSMSEPSDLCHAVPRRPALKSDLRNSANKDRPLRRRYRQLHLMHMCRASPRERRYTPKCPRRTEYLVSPPTRLLVINQSNNNPHTGGNAQVTIPGTCAIDGRGFNCELRCCPRPRVIATTMSPSPPRVQQCVGWGFAEPALFD